MEAQSLSTCNQCGKKFQRKAHLLRHQQQHSGDRPYSCKFCAKTFKRSDVLRDHFSRCERRGNSAIPNSLERGRKRHACDECSRLKVKCDNNVPCRKCQEFGRTCVKTRSAGDPTATSSPERSASATTTPDVSGSDRNSIGFLLNCASENDFIREFPKDSTLSPPQGKTPDLTNIMPMRSAYEAIMGDIPPPSVPVYNGYNQVGIEPIDMMLHNLEFDTFERQTQNYSLPRDNIVALPTPDGFSYLDQAGLEQRAFYFRERLNYTAVTLNPPHPPAKEVLDAIEMITAVNIASWIKLYFRHWHKHGPMVHEASFNASTAAPTLVLALMGLGGMYSAEEDVTARLKLLFDVMEAFIFSVPGINDEYDLPDRIYNNASESDPLDWQRYRLENVQGAYLICILQHWTGNAIARTRVRQQRFARVVAIMHRLEMQTVQHPPNFVIHDQQSFNQWILKESYVRTATIATMLDNAFGILNNVSPRFQWAELDLAFPSDDHCFKAANYDQLVANNTFPARRMKIREAFICLFTPPETTDYNLRVLREGHLTALDMQMLIHFLYTQIWTALFNNPLLVLPQTSLVAVALPFKTAMRNWKTIWDEIRSLVPESEWNKLGFQRTAETYYDTVHMLVEVWERKGGRFPLMKSDCDKGEHLRTLLSF